MKSWEEILEDFVVACASYGAIGSAIEIFTSQGFSTDDLKAQYERVGEDMKEQHVALQEAIRDAILDGRGNA